MNARHVVTIAEDELARGVVKLRDMAESSEREIPRDAVVTELRK